jgi:DNA-binding SARP family transcriptional activator
MHAEPGSWDGSISYRQPLAVPQPTQPVEFTLLGPLQVIKDGRDCAPTAPKVLQLLALLLMRAGRLVHTDSIIHELWYDGPPASVRTTLQTYVYKLRKCIQQNDLAIVTGNGLVTKPPGYILQVEPAQIDVLNFQELCRQGREALACRQYEQAAALFQSALALWSGPPMANVNCGPVLSPYGVDLQEQKRNALHLRIEAEIEAGTHRDVIGELRLLVAANPLDEELHGLLMRVLARSGRRLEAMSLYRDLRANLQEELGLEPCEELQRLHNDLLSAGP